MSLDGGQSLRSERSLNVISDQLVDKISVLMTTYIGNNAPRPVKMDAIKQRELSVMSALVDESDEGSFKSFVTVLKSVQQDAVSRVLERHRERFLRVTLQQNISKDGVHVRRIVALVLAVIGLGLNAMFVYFALTEPSAISILSCRWWHLTVYPVWAGVLAAFTASITGFCAQTARSGKAYNATGDGGGLGGERRDSLSQSDRHVVGRIVDHPYVKKRHEQMTYKCIVSHAVFLFFYIALCFAAPPYSPYKLGV